MKIKRKGAGDDELFGGVGNGRLRGDGFDETNLGGTYRGSDYPEGGAGDVQWWKFNRQTNQLVTRLYN